MSALTAAPHVDALRTRFDWLVSRSTNFNSRASASVSAISFAVGGASTVALDHRWRRARLAAASASSARAQSPSVTKPSLRHNDVHWPTRLGAPSSPTVYSGATESSRNTLGRSHSPTTASTT